MNTLNMKNFNKSLKIAADQMIMRNSAIDYDADTDQSDQYQTVASVYIEKGLSKDNLNDLHIFREKMYKLLKKRYKVSTDSITSFADPTIALKAKKVPQRARVMLGMMDILIGKLTLADVQFAEFG